MFGKPEDVAGECNARLFIADDYGDNTATIRCQLSSDHDGSHQECFSRDSSGEVIISWEKDERFNCEKHGLSSDDWCDKCL